MLKQTPSQTVGPFFSYGLTPQLYGRHGFADNVLVREETAGERIRIEGAVLDGAGAPVRDAVVEIWQADAHGRYAHPADGRPGSREKGFRSEEHTSELQSLMRISYDVLCFNKTLPTLQPHTRH